MKTTYNLGKEPVGDVYQKLIEHASSECGFALLVVRDSLRIADSGQSVLKRLETFLRSATREDEWPGTKLLGASKAMLYKYELANKVAEILKAEVHSLYEWIQPERPEDLCLLRDDGTPWLVSIAHEKDAYFELTDEEKHRLTNVLPGIL